MGGGVKPTLYGVGVVDVDYAVNKYEAVVADGERKWKNVWRCPYYSTWQNMLKRSYSNAYHKRYPSYIGCVVSEEWKRLSIFKAWMEQQDWEGMALDKDLLFEGNRVYSEETCVFVTNMVNTFSIDRGAKRGEWLIGVICLKDGNKFRSRVRNPFTEKSEHLGYFTCEQEAHNAWLKRKLELAHQLASIQTDERVAEALISRYTNYVN